jgi:hypothetical protein
MTKDQAIAAGKKLFERYLSSKPKEDNSIEVCLVQDMINGWEQPETFLAQLKIVTKSNYSNVPHLLESIKVKSLNNLNMQPFNYKCFNRTCCPTFNRH